MLPQSAVLSTARQSDMLLTSDTSCLLLALKLSSSGSRSSFFYNLDLHDNKTWLILRLLSFMPLNIKQLKHLDTVFRTLTACSVHLGSVSLFGSLLAWTLARGAQHQADMILPMKRFLLKLLETAA